jgi:pimeloyl-ACP methyl ester carboxylesterase
MNRFERIFPRSSSVVIKGAAHFSLEEAPEEIVKAIRNWWKNEVDQKGESETYLATKKS